jgi:hypothetical protein
MGKIAIRSDEYFNNKTKIDMIWGPDVCPVDLNAAYVPVKTQKWGMAPEGQTETQNNIRERFGLETPEGDDESVFDGGGES